MEEEQFTEAVLHRHSLQRAKQSGHPALPHWRWFTNKECGYVVEFPSRPFENPYTLSNRQSAISYRQFASALDSNHAFMVATLVTSLTNDFTDDQIKLLFDKSMKGSMRAGDRLISERDITIGTNLGREVEILKIDDNFLKMRFYQVGHDLQQLTVLVPVANQQSTNITRFLDSFRLLSR